MATLVIAGPLFVMKQHDDSIEVPPFAVSVKLSRAAEEGLRSMNAPVSVGAYIYDSAPGENGEWRVLASEGKRVNKSKVEFSGLRLPLKAWQRLSDKDYLQTCVRDER